MTKPDSALFCNNNDRLTGMEWQESEGDYQ